MPFKSVTYVPGTKCYPGARSLPKALNIEFYDFTADILRDPDPMSFSPLRMFGHYNEKGYLELAARLKEIVDRGVESAQARDHPKDAG